jgi:hypothetical protein
LTPRLTEFSYEQAFAKGKIDAIAGRAITENDFAVSPAYWGDALYCTFQNNGICGTPIVSVFSRPSCARGPWFAMMEETSVALRGLHARIKSSEAALTASPLANRRQAPHRRTDAA